MKSEKITHSHPLMKVLRSKGLTRKRSGTLIHDVPSVEIYGYWDGGSRDDPFLLNLTTLSVRPAPVDRNPPQFGGQRVVLEPKDNVAVVILGSFQGKPKFPRIYLPPTKD